MLTKDLLISKTPLPNLTPAQDRILSHLLTRPDEVAYMSSAELAQTLNMSNATVVRFSQHIGFKGYMDLQRHIREIIKARLSVPQRIQRKREPVSRIKDLLKTVLKSDQANLTHAAGSITPEVFEELVKEIHSRREIWVLGLRSCHGIAQNFATNLRFLSRRVNLITLDTGTVWDQIQPGLNRDAFLLAISFPRYSRLTYDITRQFSKAGAAVAAITDSPASPLSALSRMALYLPCWIDSFFESHVAAMSVLNAVLAGVAYVDGSKTMPRLQALEALWEEKEVYLKPASAAMPSWAEQLPSNSDTQTKQLKD